jgi:hypothetical protein
MTPYTVEAFKIRFLGSPGGNLCGHGCGSGFFSHQSVITKHPRSRPKLRIAVVFSLSSFLFNLFVLFMFACKRCPDGFNALSAGGLRKHQKNCSAFLKLEDDTNQRRKAAAALNKVKRAKLKDRKMRLNSAAPGVSLFVKYPGHG